MIALLQNNNGEETTAGVAEKAKEAVQDTGRESFNLLRDLREFGGSVLDYLTGPEFIGNVLASLMVAFMGVVIYRVLTHGVPRVLRWRRRREEILDAEAVERIKRQDTAITLIRNALRYVIFIIIVLVVLSIFIKNPLPATAGATILAAVLGFGAQSFLRDIIAGFSIVFEGQYSVGDFIHVHPPQGVSGIVEELGLRMTKLRTPSGELVFIPNGTITGITTYISGQQRFTIEVQLKDEEAVSRVLESLKETSELYLMPPRLMGREEADGRVRLRVRASVLPSMEWLVEENLTERIKAAAGEDSLAAEPLTYMVDRASLTRIRNLIPQSKDRR